MISLLPMTKPNIGLSITRDSICLVEVSRNWRGATCRHVAERVLPPDLLRLSPARPNIGDAKEFAQCLSTLIKHLNLPQAVALSLPDLCGRTTVLTFSSFPSKKTEQDALVRWQFQQELNISTDKTRFAYRPFAGPTKESGLVHILATAVQHDIIEQYEQACLEVGLLPNSVGLAGLDVFDFYQSSIHDVHQQTRSDRDQSGQECLFLYLANWGFSFLAFHQHHPTFLRVKALPIPRLNQEYPPVEQQEDSPERLTPDHSDEGASSQQNQDYSPAHINNVSNELVATLQYYFESLQYMREEHHAIPLFFAEGLRQGECLLPTEDAIKDMLNASMSHPPPLMMKKFTDTLTPRTKKTLMNSVPQMTSFSAFASVMVLS